MDELITLFDCIKHGDVACVKTMVKNNPALLTMHNKTADKKTALAHAVQEQKISIVQWLIEQGVDVNQTYYEGLTGDCCNYTPLYAAVELQNVEMVEALLKAGAHPNMLNECLLTGPLLLSVQQLCENPHPLSHPSQQKWVAILKLLVSFGADIDYDFNARTALGCAKMHKNKELIDLLVSLGAKESIYDYTVYD